MPHTCTVLISDFSLFVNNFRSILHNHVVLFIHLFVLTQAARA